MRLMVRNLANHRNDWSSSATRLKVIISPLGGNHRPVLSVAPRQGSNGVAFKGLLHALSLPQAVWACFGHREKPFPGLEPSRRGGNKKVPDIP